LFCSDLGLRENAPYFLIKTNKDLKISLIITKLDEIINKINQASSKLSISLFPIK